MTVPSFAWMLVAILTPLVFAALIVLPHTRHGGLRLAPFAALPALVLALTGQRFDPVHLAGILLDTRLGLDDIGALFLFFSALLWTLAGLYGRTYLSQDPRRARFTVFFLVTMCGHLALPFALDLVSFYAAFALMSFAAYGLVVHRETPAALRAGRIYIVLVVIGESLLLVGFLGAGFLAGSIDLGVVSLILSAREGRIMAALLFLGFGVKMALVPLHVWLPVAHSMAPTPASAVLSGVIIKAGLLGWLRFLPLGRITFGDLGTLALVLGITGMAYGIFVGLTQRDPKSLLAYSSISQMGFITTLVGIGMVAPDAWPVAWVGALVYASHHALAKGALFLGVGVVQAHATGTRARRLALGGMGFAALSLAGAPLTSGGLAKRYMKDAALLAPDTWATWTGWAFPIAAVGTTLLMARLLFLLAHERQVDAGHITQRHRMRGLWTPWALLLLAVAGASWIAPVTDLAGKVPVKAFAWGALWGALWPVLIGVVVALGVRSLHTRTGAGDGPVLPVGDLVVIAEAGVRRITAWHHKITPGILDVFQRIGGERLRVVAWIDANWLHPIEVRLMGWHLMGFALFVIFGILVVVLR